jgi:regulator of sigma E protease
MSYVAVFTIVGVLIFLHELGHFAMARWAGIPITRVSLGVGRALWSLRRGGTEYRISVIPIGGYVLPDIRDGGASFLATPVRARILFTLGGPLANVLVAFALFSLESVIAQGPSFHAAVTDPLYGIGYALGMIVRALPSAFSGSAEVAGLIGVVAQGGDFIGGDFVLGLRFAVVMSLNLAILNMLPFPPLDGGKCVLYGLEWLHAGARRLQVPLNLAGLALLLGFICYTTVADIVRLVQAAVA